MSTTDEELRCFCEKIRNLRKEYGLSKNEMARRIHVSPDTLRKLEKGILPPRLSSGIIFHLCDAFHISPKQLFRD